MAIVALHSAATGLRALSTDLDVIANNLANANTNGYKALRSNFEDLMYLEKMQPGIENANGDQTPAGLFVGLGTRIANTQLDLSTGSPVESDNDFAMMIDGNGFFKVRILQQDLGTGIAYTRNGNFSVNRDGDLVLGNSEGTRLEPAQNIPQDATQISISADGTISGLLPGAAEPQELGRIELATFVNPTGLKPIGKNLFIETAASGPEITGNPAEGNFGTILHKFIESSNVDPVKELVNLIKTQRSFEMNSQSIQAADEALQVISNLRRF